MHTREARLRQSVLDALAFEPSVDATRIRVIVVNGMVTLAGHVLTYAEKIAAERVVQRVKGVRGIVQDIEVRHPATCADDQITERATSILSWDVSLQEHAIQVDVQRGWLTLTGAVAWNFQKLSAGEAIRRLPGVTGVTNSIAVRPSTDTADIKRKIEDALRRDAEIEARGIRVAVVGGKVRLEGKVRAWHERTVAERAAWAVSGVTSVEDHLVVR